MGEWRDSPAIRRISKRSVERIATLFDVSDKAYSVGGVTLKLMADRITVQRVVAVMLEHGLLEKIETNFVPYYRSVGKVR